MTASPQAPDPADDAPAESHSPRPSGIRAWAQEHPVLAAGLYAATITLISAALQLTGALVNASATRHGPASTANATLKAAQLAAQAAERDTDLEVLTSNSSICPRHMSAPACRAATAGLHQVRVLRAPPPRR